MKDDNDKKNSMRAVVMTKYGAEDVIQIHDSPRPQIRDDQVLVEVYSAAINSLDIKLRKGEMKPILTYKLPMIIGSDLAGKMLEVGPKVTRFKKGDDVYTGLSTSEMGAFFESFPVYLVRKRRDCDDFPTAASGLGVLEKITKEKQ